MNKDINRREQIIFKQDYDKNSGDKFNQAYKDFKQKYQDMSSDEYWEKNDQLYSSYYVGGIRRFNKLSLEQLQQLVKEDFIDTEDYFNGCPTVGEFLKFVNGIKQYVAENPDYTSDDFDIYFIGYAVDISRDDYRVTIEGVEYSSRYKVDREIMIKFMDFAKSADELDVTDTKGRAWWD